MSPITNRAEAKEGGFAQVRDALVSFEADVVDQDARGQKTGFGMWGAGTNTDGTPRVPKEFLEIVCTNVVPLEVTEDLSMDISEGFTFRVNCSDFKGSFWIDAFLESADRAKVQIPDGLVGKRIAFKRFTLVAHDKNGAEKPQFNATNYIIDKVVSGKGVAPAPKVVKPVVKPAPVSATPNSAPISSSVQTSVPEVVVESGNVVAPAQEDPMAVAMELAVGKTEQQFRSAIALNPVFANSPLLSLAKAGAITQTLMTDGKLKLVLVNGKQVYSK